MSTTTKTTTAQTIAAQLGDDGQTYRTDDGRDLDELCEAAGARTDARGSSVRYDFPDGSSIVDSCGAAWDLGLPEGCHCWAGQGHNEDCEHAGERAGLTADPHTHKIRHQGHYLDDEQYPSETDACIALQAALGWSDYVTSRSFAVDEQHEAVAVYETDAECEADLDGAYAPWVVEL